MISDPATLKSVLGDPVTFIRSPQQQQIVRMLIGEGSLLYADGESATFFLLTSRYQARLSVRCKPTKTSSSYESCFFGLKYSRPAVLIPQNREPGNQSTM
jgi:hypothetical protein